MAQVITGGSRELQVARQIRAQLLAALAKPAPIEQQEHRRQALELIHARFPELDQGARRTEP